MCGLSGFHSVNCDKQSKLMLILGLADGIDNRGGHACGYVSVKEGKNDLNYARKKGLWVRSRLRFIEGAAEDICMMHARYATCGNRDDANNAHPFAIRRNGRVVLWGAHNGMVPEAFKCAAHYGRKIQVDSQEIFELIADGNLTALQNMGGYGVITWIDTDHRDYVNLARLSSHSEIVAVSVKGGGVVWASTKKILDEALKFADLEVDKEFKLDEIGRVYRIYSDGIRKSKLEGYRVGNYTKWKGGRQVSSSEDPGVPEDSDTIDEQAIVEQKDFIAETSYAGSGAYSPNPSNWHGYGSYD